MSTHATCKFLNARVLDLICRHIPPIGIMLWDKETCDFVFISCQAKSFQHPTENPNEPSNTDSAEKSRLMLFNNSRGGTSPLV